MIRVEKIFRCIVLAIDWDFRLPLLENEPVTMSSCTPFQATDRPYRYLYSLGKQTTGQIKSF